MTSRHPIVTFGVIITIDVAVAIPFHSLSNQGAYTYAFWTNPIEFY